MLRAALILSVLSAGGACAQSAPSSLRFNQGPSVQFTRKYIQDHLTFAMKYIEGWLNTLRVSWRETWHGEFGDSVNDVQFSVLNTKADPQSCSLSFQTVDWEKFEDNSDPATFDGSENFSLREVATVTVERYAPSRSRSEDKEILAAPYAIDLRLGFYEADESPIQIILPTEDAANRLARAIIYAVDLCGGGGRDLFR